MTRPAKVILCVDDNADQLGLRRFLLETHGYRVIAMTSATAALRKLSHAEPDQIDLLVSDLVMSPMCGRTLVRKAKEICPWLRAMLVSGEVTVAKPSRADDFVPKGTRPVDFLARVRTLAMRRRGPVKRDAARITHERVGRKVQIWLSAERYQALAEISQKSTMTATICALIDAERMRGSTHSLSGEK